MEINSSQSSISSASLQPQTAQSAKTDELTELEKQQQQQNTTSTTEQAPQISSAGSRLAAANNGSDNGDTPAITNDKEAQKVLDQIRNQMKTDAVQAQNAHSGVSSELVAGVI